MPVTFSGDWAQEVADVSGLTEYQNALIEIRDPFLVVRTGSITDGYEYDASGAIKWTGQARVASNRSSVGAGGNTSTNPTNIKKMRVQVPYAEDFIRVKRGWQVRVLDGGRNDRLEGYLFSIESDVNSSHVGSVTFDCAVDVEAEPNWSS